MTAPELLTSTEVCTAAGITYRQLTYWTARGAIDPARGRRGQGYSLRFHPNIVAPLRTAGAVARALERRAVDVVAEILDNHHAGALDLGDGIRLTWPTSGFPTTNEGPKPASVPNLGPDAWTDFLTQTTPTTQDLKGSPT